MYDPHGGRGGLRRTPGCRVWVVFRSFWEPCWSMMREYVCTCGCLTPPCFSA